MQINQNFRNSYIPEKLTADIINNSIFTPIESILNNLDIQLKKFQQDLDFINQTPTKQNGVIKNDKLFSLNDETVDYNENYPTNSNISSYLSRLDAGDNEFKFYSKYKEYKSRAMEAYRNRKIFTIFTYMPRIRRSLKNRGWVEKCSPNYLRKIQVLPLDQILRHARDGNDYETVAISKLIHPHPPQFIWQPKYPRIELKNKFFLFPIRNRIYKSRELDFTSKLGLIGCIELSHWNIIPDISEVRVPRHFRLNSKEEQAEFLDDYKTTYCISLLLYVTEGKSENIFSEFGSVSLNILKFALNRVRSEISRRLHFDIDAPTQDVSEAHQASRDEWQRFYLDCDLIQGSVMRFDVSGGIDYKRFLREAKDCINEAKLFWPTLETDGFNNIWILKPANCCRGHGIFIRKNFADIIDCVSRNHGRKYIVQKYIERPLLIYNTKFDIRQYFMVTISDEAVCVWMYRDCYLKFSSQEYDLQNFKESIHITNNAVQKKYRNALVRSKKLPQHNMWHLNQFITYLKEKGELDNIWENKVYPAMRKNIISIVSTSLDETEFVPNSFEIYGCDFILDQNYEPFLLEINATPDMSPSTKVTAKLCPQVLEDVIKVVIDYQDNPKSSTGEFELIFKTQIPKVPLPLSLSVIGKPKPITKIPFDSILLMQETSAKNGSNKRITSKNQRNSKIISKTRKFASKTAGGGLSNNYLNNFDLESRRKVNYNKNKENKKISKEETNQNETIECLNKVDNKKSPFPSRNESVSVIQTPKLSKKLDSNDLPTMNAKEAVTRFKQTVERIKSAHINNEIIEMKKIIPDHPRRRKLNSNEKFALTLKTTSPINYSQRTES